jgi:hypothetical protein
MFVAMLARARLDPRLSAGPLAFCGVAVLLATAPPAARGSSCPAAEEIHARLSELELERAARTARFSTPPPSKLYGKAARKVGKVFIDRDGKKGFGVVVAELPVEVLWRAINDEDGPKVEEYLPLSRAEVIGGTPRGRSRRVFQSGERMGLGRWWVVNTVMSEGLYEESGSALWEITWQDDMENVDPDRPPVDDPPDLSPIEWSRGAWLLVPLAEECTLLEHFTWSSPGGFVGFIQGLVLGRALRQSVEGTLRMADEQYRVPPEGPPFVRPDGSPLSEPAEDESEPTSGAERGSDLER